jgi:Ca2+-binding EF-hand superfamily protein
MGSHSSKKESVYNKSKKSLSKYECLILKHKTGLEINEINNIYENFVKNSFEKDKNIYLDKPRFIKLYSQLRPESEETLRDISKYIFNSFDLNKDNVITFKEFLIAYAITSRGYINFK